MSDAPKIKSYPPGGPYTGCVHRQGTGTSASGTPYLWAEVFGSVESVPCTCWLKCYITEKTVGMTKHYLHAFGLGDVDPQRWDQSHPEHLSVVNKWVAFDVERHEYNGKQYDNAVYIRPQADAEKKRPVKKAVIPDNLRAAVMTKKESPKDRARSQRTETVAPVGPAMQQAVAKMKPEEAGPDPGF